MAEQIPVFRGQVKSVTGIGTSNAQTQANSNARLVLDVVGGEGFPADTDVRAGVEFDGNLTGNLVLPTVNQVEIGVLFGAHGEEFIGLASSSNGNIFFQDTDPGAVGANAIWVDFANSRIGIRDITDTSWSFYTSEGGIGAIGSSGYGIGAYGQVTWDETTVNSSVLTLTSSLGLYKPLYATVGWGKWINSNMDKIEALNVRLLALEAAV